MIQKSELPKGWQMVDGCLVQTHGFNLIQSGDKFFDAEGNFLSSYDITDGKVVILSQHQERDEHTIEIVVIKNGGEEMQVTRTFNQRLFQRFCDSLIIGLTTCDDLIQVPES